MTSPPNAKNMTQPEHICLVRLTAHDGGAVVRASMTCVYPDSLTPVPGLHEAGDELGAACDGLFALISPHGACEHRLALRDGSLSHALGTYPISDDGRAALVYLEPQHLRAALGERALIAACAHALAAEPDSDDMDAESWSLALRTLGDEACASLAVAHAELIQHLSPSARARYEELHPELAEAGEVLF